MTKNSKTRRGFAVMNAEQLKAISSRGGKTSRGGRRKRSNFSSEISY